MTDHPINATVIDAIDVSKPTFRDYVKNHTRLVVATTADVNGKDLSDAFGIDFGGTHFNKDTGDTTTADDGGRSCLVDLLGTRFKRVPTSTSSLLSDVVKIVASGSVDLAAHAEADEIEIDNISGGPIDVFLMDIATRNVPIMITDVANNADVNTISIKPKAGSGQTLPGGTGVYTLDSRGAGVILRPNSDKTGWK